MKGARPHVFVFDETSLPEPEVTEPRCSVPGCGHPESAHVRCHCQVCHTVSEAVLKATGFKPGMCVHYYFPPIEPKEEDQ